VGQVLQVTGQLCQMRRYGSADGSAAFSCA
jgi:hypothetical protein